MKAGSAEMRQAQPKLGGSARVARGSSNEAKWA